MFGPELGHDKNSLQTEQRFPRAHKTVRSHQQHGMQPQPLGK